MRQTAIPYMQLRGGSSKGIYFQNTDLPADHDVRSAVLKWVVGAYGCLLYTSPSPRDKRQSRMPSSA